MPILSSRRRKASVHFSLSILFLCLAQEFRFSKELKSFYFKHILCIQLPNWYFKNSQERFFRKVDGSHFSVNAILRVSCQFENFIFQIFLVTAMSTWGSYKKNKIKSYIFSCCKFFSILTDYAIFYKCKVFRYLMKLK